MSYCVGDDWAPLPDDDKPPDLKYFIGAEACTDYTDWKNKVPCPCAATNLHCYLIVCVARTRLTHAPLLLVLTDSHASANPVLVAPST